MNKTAALFATLTARYGAPTPKDGQEMQAVAQCYEAALSSYGLSDLAAACSSWMSSTKYPRWPEPAELVEILSSFGARPERTTKELPQHVKMAASDASSWYRGLLSRPLPHGAWPCRWEDALCHVIGADDPRHNGKSFGWLLTRAWLDGVIPAGFDGKASAFFEEKRRGRQAYLAAVQERGAAAIHERQK